MLRFAYLDGLRALAAGYVVLFHAVLGFAAGELTGPWRILRRALAYGHEAVAVFIVLSGYCLMLPVAREEAYTLRVDLRRFFRRRALRILPPYYAALAASIAALALLPPLRSRSGTIWDESLPGLELDAIATHLLLLHNWSPAQGYQINGPLWSVASEWQIYFAFPLILLPLWRRFGVLVCVAAAVLLGCAPLLFAERAAAVAIPWYLALFAFGMVAAAIGFSPERWAVVLRTRLRWGVASAALWIGCFVLGMGAADFWFAHKWLSDLLIGLAVAVVLVHLTERARAGEPTALLSMLESRALVGVGHFSYSLYLTHLPVLAVCFFALRGVVSGPPLALALAAAGGAASLVVAYVFHLTVERRFLVKR